MHRAMHRAHLGTPSFHPLYEAQRSVDLPEAPDWLTRADFTLDGDDTPAQAMGWTQWTDVLVDFRVPHARTPLPAVLPVEDFIEWDSQVEGWSLRGWAFKPEDAPTNEQGLVDAVSVVVFTDPTGFRFAFAVSADKPGEKTQFAGGRFSFLLPTMRFVFLHTDTCHNRNGYSVGKDNRVSGVVHAASPLIGDGFVHPSQTYSLEVLRDAVRDPGGWFADQVDDFVHATLPGPFRPITAARALLAWAAAGATSYASVAPWVTAGLDPAEVAGWLDLNDPETNAAGRDPETGLIAQPWSDADIIDWFSHLGGGRKRRTMAVGCRTAGLTPDQSARWLDVLAAAPTKNRAAVLAFEDGGWTPEDVTTVTRALHEDVRRDPNRYTFSPWQQVPLDEVGKWTFLPADTAVFYIRAGLRASESREMAAAGESVDTDTLMMLSGLRPTELLDLF